MFTYTKCWIVLNGLYLGTFGKLGFDYLEEDDYTDYKFIFGVTKEGIMKSDRLKLGLFIIRHSSLSLDMNNIEYWVINWVKFVIIKCKNINIYLHNVQLQCLKAVFEYAIEPMEICLHK